MPSKEQKQERGLEERGRYGSLIREFQGVVFKRNFDCSPLFLKGALKEITGYTEKDFFRGNLRWDQIIYPVDLPKIYQQTEKLRTIPHTSDEREYRIIQKNGSVCWIREFVHNVCDEKEKPLFIQGAFYGITKRKLAEQRLTLQYSIARILASADNHNQGVFKTLKVIGETIGWQFGTLWVVDREEMVLCCNKIWHAPTLKAPKFKAATLSKSFARGVGLPGRVWIKAEPIWLTDVTKTEYFLRSKEAEAEKLHAAFAFPVCLGNEILGVIEFFNDQIRPPDKDLLQMISAIGNQLGQFIERKRVEKEKERLLLQVEKERWRAEQLALEAEKRAGELDAIFMAMLDPLIVYDANGIVVSANPAAVALYGFSPVGKDRRLLINKLSLSHLGGEFVKVEEVPSSQALQGKATTGGYLSLINARGESCVVSSASSPIVRGEKVLGAVATFHDVTEYVRLEKQKDNFIATASHELKTPVTTLKAYTQILEKHFRQIKDQDPLHYLTKMDLQLDKLTSLVAELLDVTRIGAERLALNEERFDFDELIDGVVEDVRHTADCYQIFKKGERVGKIYGDKDRLGQVLTNLLSNAVKYSPGGCKVIIRTKKKNDRFIVSVRDFGVGISAEDQRKVFDRFYRVDGPGGRRFSGLGLGLYISSEIIKQHGGKIWVKSKKGLGSTFFFDLPIKRGKKGKD